MGLFSAGYNELVYVFYRICYTEAIIKRGVCMNDFSRSGDFGEVEIFQTCIPSGRFRSLDHIYMSGYHCVNELYGIERKSGSSKGLCLLTVGGSGNIRINGTEYTAKAGTAVLFPPNRAHAYMGVPGERWEFYWFHYSGAHSMAYTEDILQNGCIVDVGVSTLRLILDTYPLRLADGIEREIAESEWLSRLLSVLLRQSVSACCDDTEQTTVHRMISFLELESEESFSLERLAAEFHYSKEYMIRIFKKATGISPYQHWLSFRMKRSCDALRNGNRTIEEIALECGYRTVSGYSNQFKKKFGISPKEYRNLFHFVQN